MTSDQWELPEPIVRDFPLNDGDLIRFEPGDILQLNGEEVWRNESEKVVFLKVSIRPSVT